MQVEHTIAALGNGFDNVDPGAGRVPNIRTKTDARVHVADMRQDVLGPGEVLVFGTMIVHGYLNVVLLHEALDARERLRGGAHDHERHAAVARVFEVEADMVVVFSK